MSTAPPHLALRLTVAALALLGANAAAAQDRPPAPPEPPEGTAKGGMEDMPGMQGTQSMPGMAPMPGMDKDGMQGMHAMLGPYPAMRESSGTSWQPESAPMMGVHIPAGAWEVMAEGSATFIYTDQGGPRGGDKAFSESMAMLMASRAAGANGRVGLRAMLSLEPLMGKRGYPLLFAAGETADGRTELVDRQHPHDLFMELSASYSLNLGGGRAVYLYAGLPGEPALGPPTFMHRLSGMMNPEAPIGHHWADSTHITFGVVTAGFSSGRWKIEGSAFRGREPDQNRWDIETPKLDSWSARLFYNPDPNLSLQVSHGYLHSPEQLRPQEDEYRTTASLSYNKPLAGDGRWSTTLAWLRKDIHPGPKLDGWLAETAFVFGAGHTVFGRVERIDADELFAPPSPLAGRIFGVDKASLGYSYTIPLGGGVAAELGGVASAFLYPNRLLPIYGRRGVKAFTVFTRIKLGG